MQDISYPLRFLSACRGNKNDDIVYLPASSL
jgi:hypothetical protein